MCCLNLDAAAAENVTEDETTWGEVGVRCRTEVEVDPPLWLSSLEEEDPLKHQAPRCEEAPLARRSSGATSPLLMLFARRSFEGHPWNFRSGRLPSPPTTMAAGSRKNGSKESSDELIGGRSRRKRLAHLQLQPSEQRGQGGLHHQQGAARKLRPP
jgi:hypothetical protein